MAILFRHPVEGVGSYAGGKLYFYDPGTTSARDVYQDADLTIAHAQPVAADADGEWAAIYLPTGTYRAKLTTSANVTVYDQDDCDPGVATGPGALPVASGGTGATNAVTARSNLGAAAASDMTSAQDDISTIQAQISASLLDSNTRLGALAGRDTVRAVDLDDTEFGIVVAQRSFTAIAGPQTTGNTIPADTSTPQIGEGAQLWSLNFTPKFDDSTIRVRAVLQFGTVSAAFTSAALFDGDENAVAAVCAAIGSTTITTHVLEYDFSSWGLTAKNLSIRWGPSSGTGYLNRPNSSGVTLGDRITSSVEVIEFKGGAF